MKKLTETEFTELQTWLQLQETNYKNLNRDFSDALPVANILKNLFPKLVELNNYPPRNNTQLKLSNWKTLNFKVLGKLGLRQNTKMLEMLAKGIPGAVESLLYHIMQLEREQKKNKDMEIEDNEQEKIWQENDEIMTVAVNKMIGDALVQIPQKMILYSIYEQMLKESQAKNNYIAEAQQKITHLEKILELKAERIDELTAQLAKVAVTSLLEQHKCSFSGEYNNYE